MSDIKLRAIVDPAYNFKDGSVQLKFTVDRSFLKEIHLVDELLHCSVDLTITEDAPIPRFDQISRYAMETGKLKASTDEAIARVMGDPSDMICEDDRVVDEIEPELNDPRDSQSTRTLRSRIFLHLKNAGVSDLRGKLCMNTYGVEGLRELNEYQLQGLFNIIMRDYVKNDSPHYQAMINDPLDVKITDYGFLKAKVREIAEGECEI